MQNPCEARPACPHEWARAFQLVFQHVPKEERTARVNNALRLLRQGELDPAGVVVVPGPTELQGAMVCQPVPGASGLVWPPQAVPGSRQQEIEDQLLQYAIGWLRERGSKLGQTLLREEEIPLANSLERHGF